MTMEKKEIKDDELEKVVGGSIMFNKDMTTCGYNRIDQYKVLNFQAIMDYINENSGKMSERRMLANMVEAGYLTEI